MTGFEKRLRPPTSRTHTSVSRVADDWYIVCQSGELRDEPLARTLLGSPLVLFRDGHGQPGALLDRCPHRNVPLSLGTMKGEALECAYHGWQFDRLGVCRAVPGLVDTRETRGRRVPAYPTKERDGFVWVYGVPDEEPGREPFAFPYVGMSGYTTVRQEVAAEGSVHAVAENALDVPHTAFLHRNLFRTARDPREIQVVVKREGERVEAEYIGEPRPSGLAGRVLAPGGGTVVHFDRFILPSIVQVEYRLGEDRHLCVTSALTPVSDFYTRLFAVASFRLGLPGWLLAPILRPVMLRIFKQDADMLTHQTRTIEQFDGERYESTELDVLGPHILRLLRSAERGERGRDQPFTRAFRMLV